MQGDAHSEYLLQGDIVVLKAFEVAFQHREKPLPPPAQTSGLGHQSNVMKDEIDDLRGIDRFASEIGAAKGLWNVRHLHKAIADFRDVKTIPAVFDGDPPCPPNSGDLLVDDGEEHGA